MGSSPANCNPLAVPGPNPGEARLLDDLTPFGPDAQHQCILIPQYFSVPQGIQLKWRVQQFCLAQLPLQRLVLDFQHTHFMDSSGVGSLIACRKLLAERQTELVLQRLSPQVRMVLQLTELDQVFTIEQGEAEPRAMAPIDSAEIVTHPSVHSRAKRLLDIVGAIVGLGITAIAAIPIIIAIKLEDGGPIFFGQMRCSWLGKPFRIWKFRSMVIDAEARKAEVKNELQGALFKNARDHRITPIGRFLRRTSLDELPQFWNVLRGEMSLVGTRPPTVEETEQYEIPQWRRLDIKPGMTGEWQVNGRSTVKTFEDVVQLDLKYQRNWSLWYDIKLILKTIVMVFTKRSGAV